MSLLPVCKVEMVPTSYLQSGVVPTSCLQDGGGVPSVVCKVEVALLLELPL
jgi:hypothetical protein